MWRIILDSVGANRSEVILTIHNLTGKPIRDAKFIIDSANAVTIRGDRFLVTRIAQSLRDLGVVLHIEFDWDNFDPTVWVDDSISEDKRTCQQCGQSLFYFIPGKTSDSEVIVFRKQANLPLACEGELIRAMPVGVYCLSGCVKILIDFPIIN
jgi:hypothetical protein